MTDYEHKVIRGTTTARSGGWEYVKVGFAQWEWRQAVPFALPSGEPSRMPPPHAQPPENSPIADILTALTNVQSWAPTETWEMVSVLSGGTLDAFGHETTTILLRRPDLRDD